MSDALERDGPGLAYRDEEWELLAVKWPSLQEADRDALYAKMTRPQRRRFDRTVAKLHEGKRDFAGKHTTREDVAVMLGLYIERHIMPLAADMDLMAKDLKEIKRWYDYQRLPWWRKLRIAVNVRLVLAQRWLEAKGIRFVRTEQPEVPQSDGADGVGVAKAPDDEGGSSGFAAPAPSLHSDGASLMVISGAASLIEVVPR